MAGRRKGWSKLSPDYRKRLQRQGITAASYKRGVDLRSARGKPTSRGGSAPRAATDAALTGQGTVASRRVLEEWRKVAAPRWLPTSEAVLDTDTVAALSRLPNPRQWGNVHFDPRAGGQPWTMTVDIKGGYPVSIEIPGGSDARDVLHLLSAPDWFDMDDLASWEAWLDQYEFDVGETV